MSLEIILRDQQIKRNRLWAADRNDAEDPGKAGWVYERKFVTGKRSHMVILSILKISAVNISKTLKCFSLVLTPTHQVCFSSRTRNPYQGYVGKGQPCPWEEVSNQILIVWSSLMEYLTSHGNITQIQALISTAFSWTNSYFIHPCLPLFPK